MIKPDMIPKECFVAYQRAFKRGGGVGDALAAALNAWPGFEYRADVAFPAFGYGPAAIILPLPQEARNE